jgi:hypothetical protein
LLKDNGRELTLFLNEWSDFLENAILALSEMNNRANNLASHRQRQWKLDPIFTGILNPSTHPASMHFPPK